MRRLDENAATFVAPLPEGDAIVMALRGAMLRAHLLKHRHNQVPGDTSGCASFSGFRHEPHR
ncbi:hypothetical protein [Bradyrhizobium sp. UFLA03-84]|nr:hypothetical protein [Bradyrhizobium sp. UFLA03-84]